MLGRALWGLLLYGATGPVFGGLVVGVLWFLSHPDWPTALLIVLVPVAGFPIGVLPAAATGAVAGALAPNLRQARYHLVGVALLGAGLSAITAYVMHMDLGFVSLAGFIASLACERLRRGVGGNVCAATTR